MEDTGIFRLILVVDPYNVAAQDTEETVILLSVRETDIGKIAVIAFQQTVIFQSEAYTKHDVDTNFRVSNADDIYQKTSSKTSKFTKTTIGKTITYRT